MALHLNKYNIISIFLFFIILVSPNTPPDYKVICFLPILFIIFSSNKVINMMKNNYIGVRILFYLFFVKFVVSPLFISLSGFSGEMGFEPSDSSIITAVFFQAIEIITSFLVIRFIGYKILPCNKVQKEFKQSVKSKQSVVFMITVIFTILLIIISPNILSNYTLITFSSENSGVVSILRGLDIHLLDISKLLILVFIIRFLGGEARKNKKFAYIISLLLMAFYICILRGDNRLQIILSIITTLVLSRIYFPKQFKKTIIYVSLIGAIMLLTLSYYRIFGVTEWRPDGGNAVIDLKYFSGMFQGYFSGVRNTAQGFEAMEIYSNIIDTKVLFSDVFSWSGYLANFFMDIFGSFTNTTNDYYNLYLYGPSFTYGDQILPSIAQSYAYFSFGGIFIFPMIFTFGIIIVERINLKVTTVEEYIVNVQLMSILAMFVGYSISSIGMFVFGTYLIWFILFRLNNYISAYFKDSYLFIRGIKIIISKSTIKRGGASINKGID